MFISNIITIVQDLGAGVVLIVVGLSTVSALLLLFTHRYGTQAEALYELLKQRYPDNLKIFGDTKSDFPLTNWSSPLWILISIKPFSIIGITKYGIADQFRTFEKIKQFNPSDAELQKGITQIKTELKKGLWLIYGSFGVFVLGLLIYLWQ